MTSIYGTLNIGKVALSAQQMAIDVTGHNIANVNTEGYTRQRVEMSSTSIQGNQGLTMGAGVKVDDVERIYDKFIQNQIATANETYGFWEGMNNYLERVEIVFNEISGSGINQAMDDFWNAWNDLANNPSGYVERISLLSASNTLSMTINQAHENLTELQGDISTDIAGTIEDINFKAAQIKELNQQILQTETSGSMSNDLRDKRDLLVNELAKRIDINATEDNHGNINISVGSGQPLVSGGTSWELARVSNPTSVNQELIVWKDKDGTTFEITGLIKGGKIKGMLEVRDTLIPDYVSKINALAETLINSVNALHATGDDLKGVSGGLFFNAPDPNEPGKFMRVAIDDTNLIAAAASNAGVGDNTTALAIAALQNDLTMDATATFSDFYQSLISGVGNSVQYASNNLSNQKAMVDQLANYRESISGVSLDEEMVNLVKFQHAYAAAAKLISTVDEMLDSLISMT
jgi:flagellar hook-associated protein 1 FlgK